MKILFMTVGNNYHAPILLRDLFIQLASDEIKVVISTRNTRLGLRKTLARYGWKYVLYKAHERYRFRQLVWREKLQKISLHERRFLDLSELLDAFSIETQESTNVNAKECTAEIQRFQPDLIVSLYFDQIIREPLLSSTPIPPLNLHPSLLPAYAGSSPTFWVLANGEEQTGITVHEMVKKIDGGSIAYQRVIPIESNDTQFSLYRRCTLNYFQPLLDIIDLRRQGKPLPSVTTRPDVVSSYYARITNADINRFLALGRRFI